MVVVDLIYRDLAELNAHVLMCSRVHTHGVDLSEAYVRTLVYAYAQVHSTSSDRNRVRAARPGFRCAVTLSALHASMPKRTYVLA
jgi:hypothetical protein